VEEIIRVGEVFHSPQQFIQQNNVNSFPRTNKHPHTVELQSTYVNSSNFSLQDEQKEDNLTEL
jgi:hypothetical protein